MDKDVITWAEDPGPGIAWSEPYPVIPEGKRKPVQVKMAGGEGVPEARFQLYQTRDMASKVPSMWMLHDSTTGTTWYLYGHGWEWAQSAADERIQKILAGEGG